MDSYSNTVGGGRDLHFTVDTDIHLCEDPVFSSLVVADFLAFDEYIQLNFTEPYATYNKILSLVGHFSQGHIRPAVKYLSKKYDLLKEKHGVHLPNGNGTIDNVLNQIQGIYANVTPYDITQVLHEHDVIDRTPEDIFNFAQHMIDDYREWLLDSLNGRHRTRLVNSAEQPLFGLKTVEDIVFTEEEHYEAFWIGTAWALAVMDNFSYRAASGLPFGGGICLPVNLENMVAAPFENLHDLQTLSLIDTVEYLGLPEDTPLQEVERQFTQKLLNKYIDEGIVIDGHATQGKEVTAGYIRIKQGPGTADFLSIGFGWLTQGMHGAAGVLLGDAEDTAQVLARDIYFGGQDEVLFQELMQHERFKETVEPYLRKEFTDALVKWSFEDPEAQFNIASCSQSYQNRIVVDTNDTFTTLSKEKEFFGRFREQFDTGSVRKDIPKWDIGFEKAPSRQYFDYVIQRAHSFIDNHVFPEESWIYDNIGKFEY